MSCPGLASSGLAYNDPIADIPQTRSIFGMSDLVIRYVPDPHDEVGQLWFEVKSGQFSGSGFFWSNLSEIPALIERLRAFPFRETVAEKWGFDDVEGLNIVLSLAMSPAGSTGGLVVSTTVADQFDLQQRLTTKLQTDQASLDRMLTELSALVRDRAGEVHLRGL